MFTRLIVTCCYVFRCNLLRRWTKVTIETEKKLVAGKYIVTEMTCLFPTVSVFWVQTVLQCSTSFIFVMFSLFIAEDYVILYCRYIE